VIFHRFQIDHGVGFCGAVRYVVDRVQGKLGDLGERTGVVAAVEARAAQDFLRLTKHGRSGCQ